MRALIVGFAVMGILFINGIKTIGTLALVFVIATLLASILMPGKKSRKRKASYCVKAMFKRRVKRYLRRALRTAARVVIYGLSCL